MSPDDKLKINKIIESTLKWMETKELTKKDEFEHKA
jgi:hypothetical protein